MTKIIQTEVIIKIPFHDVDSAQIAWHGHYAKYFEIARCELLDLINYNYPQMTESGYFWPVTDLKVRFVKPIRFQQDIKVKATLKEWENRLVINYLISDEKSGLRLTKGSTTQVAVEMASGELLFASPKVLLDKIEAYKVLEHVE